MTLSSYHYDGKEVSNKLDLNSFKLGKQTIEATVFHEGEQSKTNKNITVLNDEPPKVYTYKILNDFLTTSLHIRKDWNFTMANCMKVLVNEVNLRLEK